jgi:hypothetical protein
MTLGRKSSRPRPQEFLEVAQDFRATCSIAPPKPGRKRRIGGNCRLNRLNSPRSSGKAKSFRPFDRSPTGGIPHKPEFSPCSKFKNWTEKRVGESRIFLEENTLFEFHFFNIFSIDAHCGTSEEAGIGRKLPRFLRIPQPSKRIENCSSYRGI